MNYKRVTSDINGNPRYVFHFFNFLNDEEKKGNTSDSYNLATKKAKQIGGKKYRGKDFGGGIVLQSYNIQDTINEIKELQNQTLCL